jgi:cupin 2 domain-containing protein
MPRPLQKTGLFDRIPRKLRREISQTLFQRPGLSIHRIVSQGQTTDWLTQDFDEWVVLLSGAARLLFEKEGRARSMKPGDYIHIPAGCRHRVTWTDPAKKSVWLAVHDEKVRATRRRVRGCA